jgi:hypothetical protein
MPEDDENHVESAWKPPTADDADDERDRNGLPTAGPEERPPPRGGTPLPAKVSQRMQERFGVSEQRWFVIESFLLFLPYPLFILTYLYLPVPELPFLLLTAAYSVFAIWFGFRGKTNR